MGKLSFKNNTLISHLIIYLPQLCEKLNLFKEITIGFNCGLQNLLQAFPTVSLFKLVNAAIILAFNSSLMLHIFLVSCSTALHILRELQFGVMWLQKFTDSQYWVLLLV